MEMLIRNTYYLPDANKKSLTKLGFRHNKKVNSNDEECYYSLRFPLLEYLKSITVEGEIIVNLSDGSVELNAYNYGTNSYYPPFYQNECIEVYRIIMEDICRKFYEEFDRIGIKIKHADKD